MIAGLIEYCARNKLVVFIVLTVMTIWGIWALKITPLDAIPDLSDTQVIIYTEWMGRSPDLVEDQITYPITSTLLAAPKVQAVRGFSFFGTSFIYVIFEEGTDIYWARSRILEYLQAVKNKIPADVNPVIGPDATSLGWGFSYALVDESGKHDLSELRSMQDYNIKLALESVQGVSQVASIGGFVRQYQISIDPNRLLAYNIPLPKIMESVRQSNQDVEGRLLEFSGIEYMVRGRGYIKNISDIENIPVGSNRSGAPVLLRDVATVRLGPEIRRGIADLDGKGEVAGGIVVVRFGENVLNVIDRVKDKIKTSIAPSLPEGVKIVTTYDRTDLIHRSIDTLKEEIIKLGIAVSIVCLVFLFHLPSAFIVIITLPFAIIFSFICMHYLGVTSNIMSLSGIAIAIGVMVDASIIMVENAHKRLEEAYASGMEFDRSTVIIKAAREVGPSLFFTLLVITVGFLPVFTLQAQAGRLFTPLAYTKTFAMLFSSFLAVTATPVFMILFLRGKIKPESENIISRILHFIYEPFVHFALKYRKSVILAAVLMIAATAYPYLKLGSEFMPPLYEGTLFYMPVTAPGAGISEVSRLLQMQDKLLKTIPEVAQVFGKAGRAETATDPAPLEMFETVINLKPESEWREGMTVDKIKDEMNDALDIPGVVNSFTMPIKARTDMLATGIRTPVGIKILGSDLNEIERIGLELEKAIMTVKGTRSVYAERVNTGYFLDFEVKRTEAARYGLTTDEVLEVVKSAIGGMNITSTVEGRERYPVNLRYMREFRGDISSLKRILVPVMMNNGSSSGGNASGMGQQPSGSGGNERILQIPIGDLVDIKTAKGPTAIKSEEGMLTAYVYIDFYGRDVGSFVNEAKEKAKAVKIPDGYRLTWSGEYEYLVKTQERLKLVIPLTLVIVFFLIYINTKSMIKTAIVFLAVPFSLIGSFWFLYYLDYNMSIAVWVGLIALAGLDAETGVVMLLYLDLSYGDWKEKGLLKGSKDLEECIVHGAVKRLRPKIMTVCTTLFGLIPIMFATGAGSDVMKRIAAPMIGGLTTSTLLELIIYPAIFFLWKNRQFRLHSKNQ